MTPEGKVKEQVKEVLHKYRIFPASKVGANYAAHFGWYYMPVQKGVKGIPDFMGHCRGHFFSIETKAPGEKPEGLQALQIETIEETGGICFVINDEVSLNQLEKWLDAHNKKQRRI